MLSQPILAWILLVGRLGVACSQMVWRVTQNVAMWLYASVVSDSSSTLPMVTLDGLSDAQRDPLSPHSLHADKKRSECRAGAQGLLDSSIGHGAVLRGGSEVDLRGLPRLGMTVLWYITCITSSSRARGRVGDKKARPPRTGE